MVQNIYLMGKRIVYTRRKVTMTIAPPRVKPGLVHSLKFDLSALLMGSTSSDNGQLDRLGFQLTYLFGVNCENRLFFPCFLKLDQALSQSVENLSVQDLQKQYQHQCYACLSQMLLHKNNQVKLANKMCISSTTPLQKTILKPTW